jgi:hypothetical protein
MEKNMNQKYYRVFVSLLLLLITAVPNLTSMAATSAPEQYRVPVDQTQTLSVCGFPILRHDEGTLIFQDSFDSDGSVLWENAIFSNWRITFTNPANGKSLTSVRAYNERYVLYDDGSFQAMSAGLVAELVIPGQGLVAVNVGVITTTFDAAGSLTSILIAGEHDGGIARYVCPYLA